MQKLYLEDILPGQVYGSGTYEMTEDAIIEFAKQWDPQVFHTDPIAAKDTFFKGLAASGWHTAAATMKLLVSSEFQPINGQIGAGQEELKWLMPVRPGDVLRLRLTVESVRRMKSNPTTGIVLMRFETINQNDQVVQSSRCPMVIQARSAQD